MDGGLVTSFANYVRLLVCSIYFNNFVELRLFYYHFFMTSSRLVVKNNFLKKTNI